MRSVDLIWLWKAYESLSVLQIAFAHDSTRVLQCFIQFGSEKQRQEVFDELKGKESAPCCHLD